MAQGRGLSGAGQLPKPPLPRCRDRAPVTPPAASAHPAAPRASPTTCRPSPLRCYARRERVLSSLSLYELSRRFWQQQDYERSLVAVEQSVALKLFPLPHQPEQQQRWQVNSGPCMRESPRALLPARPPHLAGRSQANRSAQRAAGKGPRRRRPGLAVCNQGLSWGVGRANGRRSGQAEEG